MVFFAGIVFAYYLSHRKTIISNRLKDRDLTIEIRVANALEINGDLVVPVSTTFDTDFSKEPSKGQSILREFIHRYYNDSGIHHLDSDIDEALTKEGYKHEQISRRNGWKNKRYAIGTVAQVMNSEKQFYLVANSHINNTGAVATDIHLIRESLVKLWDHISTKGRKGDIVIPLVGTGAGMLKEKREDIVREIIYSFIASCSSTTYCDRLIIAIYPPDVKEYKIDLKHLQDLLICSCRHGLLSIPNENKSDTPASGEGIE